MVPSLNEERLLPRTVALLQQAKTEGILDRFVVVDGGSTDASHAICRDRGVEFIDVCQYQVGEPVRGKGDSVSRALEMLKLSDSWFVGLMDADLENVTSEKISVLFDPLETQPEVKLVKSAFDRAGDGGGTREMPGGRVSELVVRPLLKALEPALSNFRQPLSGQVAFRASEYRGMRTHFGYGLEIGMLIQYFRKHGLDSIAEVDWGWIGNRTREDSALVQVAEDVISAALFELDLRSRVRPHSAFRTFQ